MLHYVTTTQQAAEFLSWLSERNPPYLAIDTETTGVDTRAPGFHVRLCQIGTRDEAWVFPMPWWSGTVREAVDRYTGLWIMWNALFDVRALAAEDIHLPWYRIDDLMVACRLAEPHESAKLKEAAKRHVAKGAALAQGDLMKGFQDNNWGWDTVPIDFEPYVRYAAMDVILTSRLYEHPVMQRGMASPVYALEMQTLVACGLMEDQGMRIDRDYCAGQLDSLRSRADSVARQIEAEYGLRISSTQEIVAWMLANDVHITHRTKSGAPSISKDQLTEFIVANDNPALVRLSKGILKHRKLTKYASSYFSNFLELSDANGYLHANINTLQARTHRMSITRPALQTMPKPGDDPESRIVRRAVLPRYEDHVLVSADWSQIEMRIAAHVSQDAQLIAAFNEADSTGGDFFVEMGKIIYKDPGFTKKDDRRKTVKNAMYGMMYGAGAAKIAATASIPLADATEVRSGILSTFPGLNRAMSRLQHEAQEGWVTTHYGRALQVDEGKAYTGLNTYIQGTAGDCLKRAIVTLATAGIDDLMVVPVHDEIVVSCRRDDAPEIMDLLTQTMHISDFDVSVPAEAAGPLERWADDV